MKKAFLGSFGLFLIIFSFAASAHHDSQVEYEFYLITDDHLELIKEIYNKKADETKQLRNFLYDEKINFYIQDLGSYKIRTENGFITVVEEGEFSDPTLKVHTDAETIIEFIKGEKPITESLKDGSMTFEGVGLYNWLKFSSAGFVFSLIAALGVV